MLKLETITVRAKKAGKETTALAPVKAKLGRESIQDVLEYYQEQGLVLKDAEVRLAYDAARMVRLDIQNNVRPNKPPSKRQRREKRAAGKLAQLSEQELKELQAKGPAAIEAALFGL